MKTPNYNYLVETEYPAVRRVLQEEWQPLDDDALEDLLAEYFPGAEPQDVESFMRSLQKFGRQSAPIAQKALPGVIQGAMTGGSVAGPYGAIAGAIGGGALSLLSSPKSTSSGTARPPTSQRTSAVPAPMPRRSPQAPSPATPAIAPSTSRPTPGAPSSAALSQLMFLLSRPETMRALSSLMMSSAGRSAQPVGSQQVPSLAFANAISELAGEVVESYAAEEAESVSNYLYDEYGEARGDILNPVDRASLLVADLASVSAVEAEIEAAEEMEAYENDNYDFDDLIDDEWGEIYDPLDIYEGVLHGDDLYDD